MFGGRGSRSQQGVQAPRIDTKKVDAFFKKYANAESVISPEGTEQLCQDLGFTVLDPVALVLCYHCDVAVMGTFSREEFMRGMAALMCNDFNDLRNAVGGMRKSLESSHPLAKKIYSKIFVMSLETGQKQLAKEMACQLWQLLLPLYGNRALGDKWIDYVAQHSSKPAISKDTWQMVFDLVTTCRPDLSDFDEDGAWPVMIDEFVAFQRKNGGDNQQD